MIITFVVSLIIIIIILISIGMVIVIALAEMDGHMFDASSTRTFPLKIFLEESRLKYEIYDSGEQSDISKIHYHD
jgi:hypothetical protein